MRSPQPIRLWGGLLGEHVYPRRPREGRQSTTSHLRLYMLINISVVDVMWCDVRKSFDGNTAVVLQCRGTDQRIIIVIVGVAVNIVC
jgi:hypothetical protein